MSPSYPVGLAGSPTRNGAWYGNSAPTVKVPLVKTGGALHPAALALGVEVVPLSELHAARTSPTTIVMANPRTYLFIRPPPRDQLTPPPVRGA